MSRITRKQLNNLAQQLNAALNLPDSGWTWIGERRANVLRANVGHIYLEKALTGYNLYAMVNPAGAVKTLHFARTAAELEAFMLGMVTGISAARTGVQL